ncbi:MAG: hypothetical protein G01um10148_49 [Parcubacteria group bacterium Gr01-1014_8]|nr:MAG: hypothetical protein G01um10148_49 [Parcubacteria group bacterium Gr01-1014_8]
MSDETIHPGKEPLPELKEIISNTKDGWRIDWRTKSDNIPVAYREFDSLDGYYYSEQTMVYPEFQRRGMFPLMMEKTNRLLESATPKKPGLLYLHMDEEHRGAEKIPAMHGWNEVPGYSQWRIYLPKGVFMPTTDSLKHVITRTIPEMYSRRREHRQSRGVTLIDTIVGTALLMLVFVGISGAFQLSVDVVTNNKARAGAIALANERQEFIRSLPYDSVGTVGGIPSGAIVATETATLNGISYIRRTIILYGDDPKDGTGAADTNANPADFKVVKTEVSWSAHNGGLRKVALTTRVSPVGIEQAVPGGTLALSILDAASAPVANAQVTVINATTNPVVNMLLFSDNDGLVTIIGAPASAGYKIVVTKSGYSTSQTYDATAEITNPTPGHLTVALNQTTSFPFSIDLVSIKNVQTFEQIKTSTTTDTFADASQIATTTNTEVAVGLLRLVGAPGPYSTPGEARSIAIAPQYLVRWKQLRFVDTRPAQTNIAYRLYSSDGSSLIPDSELPGNSSGFSLSPVDISGISTTTYPGVSLHASLGTANESETPEVLSWEVTHDVGPLPLPNITFGLQGNKSIGNGPGGTFYKYSTTTLSTGPTAGVGIGNLEWDTYTTTVDASTGYDIASSCAPQPESLAPNEYATTKLILAPHTTNSLLVDVRGNGGLIANATVRLYRSLGYNVTMTTDSCGQAFFIELSSGSVGGGNPYSIDITAAGFQPYTATDVDVSGTSRLSPVLN